jgi:hypothetical protein
VASGTISPRQITTVSCAGLLVDARIPQANMKAVAALCGTAVRRNTLKAARDQRRLNHASPEDPLRCADGDRRWRMAEIRLTSRLRRSRPRNRSLGAPIRACQTIRFTSRPNCPEAFSRRTRLPVAGARWERGAAPADLISRRNRCAAAGRMVADGSIPCTCLPSRAGAQGARDRRLRRSRGRQPP